MEQAEGELACFLQREWWRSWKEVMEDRSGPSNRGGICVRSIQNCFPLKLGEVDLRAGPVGAIKRRTVLMENRRQWESNPGPCLGFDPRSPLISLSLFQNPDDSLRPCTPSPRTSKGHERVVPKSNALRPIVISDAASNFLRRGTGPRHYQRIDSTFTR